ncbi:MAG TPA: iron-sulfur cluster repair di-iron protein [Acidimicrobiales bacterium]|nr:iron-sulfur cluster repair di-iron protein [Acidimicrobiales bacterium]
MTDVHTSNSLGDLVAANPASARVLERYGLDYCCHGADTLADACRARDVDPAAVEADLAGLAVHGDTAWRDLDAPALAAHIVATHHAYLHEELPALDGLAAKVLGVHGERHPELVEVRRLVNALYADLEPHMLKEERILFPAITALADGPRDFPFGSIANPIRMMSLEHERDGDVLRALRSVTRDFAIPDDACASYRSLYERLEALEADTHLHILKENHTLFPAALVLADDHV